jgi:hypothetical protein
MLDLTSVKPVWRRHRVDMTRFVGMRGKRPSQLYS